MLYFFKYNKIIKDYIFTNNIVFTDNHGKSFLWNRAVPRAGQKFHFSLNESSDTIIQIHDEQYIERANEFEDILAVVKVVNTEGEVIEVFFPALSYKTLKGGVDVEQYFVHDFEFKQVLKIGVPICKIKDITSIKRFEDELDSHCGLQTVFKWRNQEWNKESILHMYGYNVSNTEGLSKTQRQIILQMIVINKLLTRFEIIDHLSFLVGLNQDKNNYGFAISKWKDDIDYVRTLDLDDLMCMEIDSMRVVKRKNTYRV